MKLCGLAAAVLLCGTASAAARCGQPSVTVRVYNYVESPASVLKNAEHEAQRLFGKAGVAICWTDYDARAKPPVQQAGDCDSGPAEIALSIVARSLKTNSADTLGYALLGDSGRGVRAYIVHSNVRNDARRYKLTEFRLLAYAMAHEMAHLLLNRKDHARRGIMMSCWTIQEKTQIESGTLWFSGDEAEILAAGAAARACPEDILPGLTGPFGR